MTAPECGSLVVTCSPQRWLCCPGQAQALQTSLYTCACSCMLHDSMELYVTRQPCKSMICVLCTLVLWRRLLQAVLALLPRFQYRSLWAYEHAVIHIGSIRRGHDSTDFTCLSQRRKSLSPALSSVIGPCSGWVGMCSASANCRQHDHSMSMANLLYIIA